MEAGKTMMYTTTSRIGKTRRIGTMTLLDAAATSSAVSPPPKGSSRADCSEPTVDESLESLGSSYQGFYKKLPNQIWSPSTPDRRHESSSSSPDLTRTSSPGSISEEDDSSHIVVTETPVAQKLAPRTSTSRPPAIITPPRKQQQQQQRSNIIPFAGENVGLPANGDAIRMLQQELKFARQEIRELKLRVATETSAGSVTAVVDGEQKDQVERPTTDTPLPPTVVVQPSEERLWERLEASEERATKLARQLRESNRMAAKLYRNLQLSHVQLKTLQHMRSSSSSIDMGLILQQSQWLRCCILLGPILLLTGHVELFAVLVVLSGITLEIATSN